MGRGINPKDSDGEVVPSSQPCGGGSPRDAASGKASSWDMSPLVVLSMGDTETCHLVAQLPGDITAGVGQTARQLLWGSLEEVFGAVGDPQLELTWLWMLGHTIKQSPTHQAAPTAEPWRPLLALREWGN